MFKDPRRVAAPPTVKPPLGPIHYASPPSSAAEPYALSDGISGSALAVPPPKVPAVVSSSSGRPPADMIRSRESPLRKVSLPPTSKSETSTGGDPRRSKETASGSDRSRELRDALAREKRLQQQIASLQQLVDSLRVEIKEKQQANADLETRLIQLESQNKEFVEKETLRRSNIEKELRHKCEELREKENEIHKLTQRHLKDLSELEAHNKKQELELAELKAEKDREIAMRDAKLDRLKLQIADALKDNSRERQQQLDELSKNLEKVQEEADVLRTQLRTVHRNSKDSCSNCDRMTAKVGQLQSTAAANEQVIKDLKVQIVALEKRSPVVASTVELHKSRMTASTSK